MHSKVSALIVLALLGVTRAQVIRDGPCPTDISVVPDFDAEKYMGLWYEYAKYPAIFEANGKCVTAQYDLQSNGEVAVTNSMINEKTNEPSEIEGTATVVDNAKLKVQFPVSLNFNVSSNYWILGTDYTDYSVVYSCLPFESDKHLEFVWILTREQQPAPRFVLQSDFVLLKNHINLNKLVKTQQTDC